MKMPEKAHGNGNQGPGRDYVLKLYVAGRTPQSARAIDHIKDICRQHLRGHYELEVIDIARSPQKADEADIIAVPALVKELPPPPRRVVGDLSQESEVLRALDIEPGN